MARLTWFGHSSFKIEIADRIVLVDPWLDGNPTSPIKSSEITKADIIYVTHDHQDHLGDAFKICNRTDAVFVGTFELGLYAQENGVKNVEGFNVGGSVEIRGVKLTMVQAFHTSTRGIPTGVVVEGEAKSVYHAGDTGLFGDMRFVGELHNLDVAMVPIGGYFTMDVRQAVEAVKLLNPKAVVPMHYKTLPQLIRSPDEFVKNVRKKVPNVKVVVLKPGENYEF